MAFIPKYGPLIEEYSPGQQIRYGDTSCGASGTTSVVATSNGLKYWRNSWKEGFTTDNYNARIRRGELLPVTPWKQFFWEGFNHEFFREYCQGGRRYKWYDNYYVGPGWKISASSDFVVALVPTVDLQYLVQKAAARIASGGWDALTFILEFKQLRRMFQGISEKFENLSRGLSPGRLHDLWLEGRYGWRTLTYDIRDLHEVLTKFDELRERYSERAGLKLVGQEDTQTNVSTGIGTYSTSNSISWTLNARGSVIADIEVPKLQFNPVTTAWEVTRLSFVVDWLWNVGQALDAATFLLLVKQYVASAGFRIDVSCSGSGETGSVGGGVTVYENHNSYISSGYYEERIPMSVSAIPRINVRLDKWKALDLLSLVLQRI